MPEQIIGHDTVAVTDLNPYVENPRKGDVRLIAESLRANGQYRTVVVNKGTHTGRPNEILAGNHTWLAARSLDWATIQVTWVDVDNDRAARIVAVDNKANDEASYDNDVLASLLEGLPDLVGTGYTDDDLAALLGEEAAAGGSGGGGGTLQERFGAFPATVLSARDGAWQARKKAWIGIGLQSEVGRSEDLVYGGASSAKYVNWYEVKNLADEAEGRTLTNKEVVEHPKFGPMLKSPSQGTSVFDPALCELIYRWFSAKGHAVIDPWAGGAVRGVIAGTMGRAYTGVELRPEQVAANRAQAHLVSEADAYTLIEKVEPTWIEGDSTTQLRQMPDASFDMAIGCPPYYDLEVYSDDPQDMSTMSHAEFDKAMIANVIEVGRVLRDDSFAVFVVGAVRDKKGHILDMRRIMTTAAEAAGMHLYNDVVLLTPLGNAVTRAANMFTKTRVLARIHQEVLVYVKGDRRAAAKRAGTIDVADDIAAVELDEDGDE